MRNGEMPAVRNRIFEDFSESGIVRNRILLGKMSTKKRNAMKDNSFCFPAFFTKKNQIQKKSPAPTAIFWPSLAWNNGFLALRRGAQESIPYSAGTLFQTRFFCSMGQKHSQGGSGGAAPHPLNGTQLRGIPDSSQLRESTKLWFSLGGP